MIEQFGIIAATSLITGVVSSFGTIAALRVDIRWLREITARHEKELRHLHTRITDQQAHVHKRSSDVD